MRPSGERVRGRLRVAGAICLWTAAVLLTPAHPAWAQTTSFEGRSLVEVLSALESAGLEVYYSSDLVRPWMKVATEPAATEPEEKLRQILAPFGLTTRPAPGGGLLIVRQSPDPPPRTGSILGVVTNRTTGRRVSGAAVRLQGRPGETITSPRGHFSFKDVPPGTYTLHIGPVGYSRAASLAIRVEAGELAVAQITVENEAARQLEAVVVNASRYDLARPPFPAYRFLPIEDIENLPDLGDDPLRAVARLPGTATGRIAAKSHFRGGEADETLIRLDGLRLRDPFHLKDFQSIFSAIDPAIVRGMDVYAGGAPVRFGDRMSGVIDIASMDAPPASYFELSQSLFNTSGVVAGSTDGGRVDWVAAARRGNLDLLLDLTDPDLGDPRYVDVYGRMGFQVGDGLRVTGNLLVFDDSIRLSDNDDEENARASYEDRYFWVRFDQAAGDRLIGSTILAHTDLRWDRSGTIVREGVSTGLLTEERAFTIESVQTDWAWQASDRWRIEFGAEAGRQEGRYDYEDEARFDVLFLTPGASEDPLRRTRVDIDPQGSYFGAYVNGRVRPLEPLTLDVGVRWDRETLTAGGDHRFSPRIGAVYEFRPGTAIRASWGRHFQSEGIEELQASDGITDYAPAQRADHLVLGLQHRTGQDLEFRLEAYQKQMDRLRPRYENFLNTKVLLPELQPDRIRIAPTGATARGVEVSLAQRRNRPLSWWLSYTWSRVEDETAEGDIPRAWDQEHSIRGGLEWRRAAWTVNVAAEYSTGWPTTAGEIIETEPVPKVQTGPRNGLRMGDYFSLDARVARDWDLPSGTFTAFLELTNITSHFNQCCVDYDVEEEDGEVSVDFDPDSYLEIFPSVGFVWRFGAGSDYVR